MKREMRFASPFCVSISFVGVVPSLEVIADNILVCFTVDEVCETLVLPLGRGLLVGVLRHALVVGNRLAERSPTILPFAIL